MNASLTRKLISVLGLSLLLVYAPAIWWIHDSNQMLLERQFEARAYSSAQLLNALVRTRADLDDIDIMFSSLQRVLWLEPELLSIDISLLRPDPVVIVSTVPGRAGQPAGIVHDTVVETDQIHQDIIYTDGLRSVRTVTPIHISRDVAGTIELRMSLETMDAELAAQLWRSIGGSLLLAAAILLVIWIALRRMVLAPLAQLSLAVEALRGRKPMPLEIQTNDEFGRLGRLFAQTSTELRAAESRIEHMAYHDTLTGLPNRRMLLDRLEQVLARAQRYQHDAALVYLDLDGFKEINDDYGHQAGDEMLCLVAMRLRACVRATDTLARIGGDEFAVLVDQTETARLSATGEQRPAAEVVAEKIVAALTRPGIVAQTEVTLGVSIGIRNLDGREQDSDRILKDADAAMYKAKSRGGSQIQRFN